ncbi:hypothetical protein LZ32DRAFT_264701 [Colletotrichum eremochloae]|nr:hypothetical protein LZ32DRAFT_264701 [Colletotrichum eremochloae]
MQAFNGRTVACLPSAWPETTASLLWTSLCSVGLSAACHRNPRSLRSHLLICSGVGRSTVRPRTQDISSPVIPSSSKILSRSPFSRSLPQPFSITQTTTLSWPCAIR